jgi:hypothetical protein
MSSSGFFTGPRGTRHLLLVALVIVVVVVVVAAALFLFNHSSSASVTVSGAAAYLEQGHTSQGTLWFGNATFPFGSGFPLTLPVGSSFTLTLNLVNDDSLPHALVAFTPNSPFTVVSSAPAAPVHYAAYGDGATTVTLDAPSTAGTYALNLTVLCQ